MNDLGQFVDEVLARHGEEWSAEDRAALAAAARSSIDLLSLIARGHDVSAEVGLVRQQAASIAAAEAHIVRGFVRDVVAMALDALLARVMPGAA